MIKRWVAFWSERESPTPIVAIRIILALVVFWDLAWVGLHGVPIWLWGPLDGGGVSPTINASHVYRWFGNDAPIAMSLYVVMMVTIVSFGVGCFTRTSALIFVLAYAQTAMINDYADRGIDRAIRIVMLILAFSECGKAWSIDAWRKTKTWRGAALVNAWPRYLVLAELVLIYCSAGFSKGGTRWLPWGDWAALYVVLQDPIFSTADFSWVAHPIPYFFTQLGTVTTHVWEMSAPIVLLAAWYRRTPDRPGRLRRWFNRFPVRNVYVLVGATFHVGLMITTHLGIFPWAMLAFYPAFFRPEELEALPARIRGVLKRSP